MRGIDPHQTEHLPGLRKFPWRLVVYGVVLLYLAADLYWFEGPLQRRIQRMRGEDGNALEVVRQEGVVATANGYPIRREELDLAVDEYCLRHGLERDSLSRQRINAIRVGVLDDLVVDRLLWYHAKQTPVEVPEGAVEAELARLRSGFESEEAMREAAAKRGFGDGRLEDYLESQAMQTAWVEAKIAEHIAVSEKELLERYEELSKEGLAGEAFEAMRDELEAALEAEKRQWAVDGVIEHLKRKAVIRYFEEYFWVR